MLKTALKTIYPLILCLALILSINVLAGASDKTDVKDTVELKNGDKITGTVLNDTFTVTTPYSNVTVEKDKISEIRINHEREDHDVIVLIEGGLMEGTLDEPVFSIKLPSGETTSFEKEKCNKLILKGKNN